MIHDAVCFTSPVALSVFDDTLDRLRPAASVWFAERRCLHLTRFYVHATQNDTWRVSLASLHWTKYSGGKTRWRENLFSRRTQRCVSSRVPSHTSHKMSVNPLQEMINFSSSGPHDCLCNISRLLLGKRLFHLRPHTAATLFIYVTVELFHSHFTGAVLTVSQNVFCQSCC